MNYHWFLIYILFFSGQWALMTLLNPTFSVENLIYIGYPGDPSSAIRVTRRRRLDRKKQHSERNVLQCFVFGPRQAGKSALLNSFIGRCFHYMLPWSFLLNNFRHQVSYLIFVEFIMQAIFWKLQSNLWGSLCCKCCWYFYGKWYKIGIWLSSYCARHFVSLTFPSTRVFFCISWHFFL